MYYGKRLYIQTYIILTTKLWSRLYYYFQHQSHFTAGEAENKERLKKTYELWGFPHSSADKESTCNAGDPGSISGLGRPLEKGQATYSNIFGLPLWLSWSRICLQYGRRGFDPWVGKISWRSERLPTSVFWPGEFHELYSPWDHKESDTTEQLSLSLHKKT